MAASNIVLASETPIAGKILKTALQSANDIPYFSSSLVDKKPFRFKFDRVVGENVSQEGFYANHISYLAKEMMLGNSSSVVLFGPSEYYQQFLPPKRTWIHEKYIVAGRLILSKEKPGMRKGFSIEW